MTEFDDEDLIPNEDESLEEESEGLNDFLIDIFTGNQIRVTPKNLLLQKVLRQLIESYGFDRADLEVNYNPRLSGKRNRRVDIAIFRPGTAHTNENLQRIVLCQTQRQRDKLRSLAEAEADLNKLKELMEDLPDCRFGIWTNGFEEFYLQAVHDRFEVRFIPLGVLPAPGEETEAADRTGGPIQVAAEAEDLQAALERCYRFLNRNLGLDHKDTFKQLAVLLLAKLYDETAPSADRRFWVRGDEPFTASGQAEIERRIRGCLQDAVPWQPGMLSRGWNLDLEADQTAQIVKELAKYSFAQTHPFDRTVAYRAIVRMVMDGKEGRYPTPLNVARMAVEMLEPKPEDRVLDCSCGTGTFLAMTAVHLYDQFLAQAGTNRDEATAEQRLAAQERTAEWSRQNTFGCELDPFLTVTTRLNLLLTAGHPGRVFRLDSRTFPDGDLDGVADSSRAIPLGTMDIVILNPWFSTQSQDTVTDATILQRYDLGKVWERTEEGGYRNRGNLSSGIPPEVLFLERALDWVKPGTGRIGILLPNGLLGNPGDEYIRWWILHHCEVIASVELPLEPFKVTVNQYRLSPALPSFLILRRRDQAELMQLDHPEYDVFMAVAQKGGVDSRGKQVFKRSPTGEELIVEEEVVERVRIGEQINIRRVLRKFKQINDELPDVAERYKHFTRTGGLEP
ncbi:MAG TPA: N-6 DNA methylase [Coleofasciculaceae cyanobacterium]|jgi:type I restriction enzyme M protein